MKKIICIVLTLMMALSLCATANAATTVKEFNNDAFATTDSVTDKADVVVNIDVASTPVYYVKIAWDNLEFMYSGGAWNPEALVYDGGAWNVTNDNGATWVDQDTNKRSVTIENRSNATINYDAYFGTSGNVEVTENNITAKLTLPGTSLPSAVGQTTEGPKAEIGVKLSGSPRTLDETQFTIGTITVKISK